MIRFAALGSLFFVLSLSALSKDPKDVPKELAPFQGSWKVVRAEVSGKTMDEPKLMFTFHGTKVDYVENDKETGSGSFAIDAKKTPTEIDLFPKDGVKALGIYKFEKDGSK